MIDSFIAALIAYFTKHGIENNVESNLKHEVVKTKEYLDSAFPQSSEVYKKARNHQDFDKDEIDILRGSIVINGKYVYVKLAVGTEYLNRIAIKECYIQYLFSTKKRGINVDFFKSEFQSLNVNLQYGWNVRAYKSNLSRLDRIVFITGNHELVFEESDVRVFFKRIASIPAKAYALHMKRLIEKAELIVKTKEELLQEQIDELSLKLKEYEGSPKKERKEPKPKPKPVNPALVLTSKIAAKVAMIEGYENVDCIRVWVDKYNRVIAKIGDLEEYHFGWKGSLEGANEFMSEGSKHNKAIKELVAMLVSISGDRVRGEVGEEPTIAQKAVQEPRYKPEPLVEEFDVVEMGDDKLKPMYHFHRNVATHGFRDDKEYSLIYDFYRSKESPDPSQMAVMDFGEFISDEMIKSFQPIGTVEGITKLQLLNLHDAIGHLKYELGNDNLEFAKPSTDAVFEVLNRQNSVDDVVVDHPEHYLVLEYKSLRNLMVESNFPAYEPRTKIYTFKE